MNYASTINHHNYRLASKSTKYDKTVSSYIAKIIKKVNSQMKAQFCDWKDLISFIGTLATFKLACNTHRIHDRAAMRVILHYGNKRLVNALNSCVSATGKSSHISLSFHSVDNGFCKFLRSYREVVDYLLKKFSTDQAIAEVDAAILWYT